MLISLAVDYNDADVATRERFHIPPDRLARVYERLGDDGVHELALLSTCNRTELYAWCPAATADTLAGVASSLTIMFATASLEKAFPAPVALGSSEREKKANAARHAAGRTVHGRLAPRPGTCQPWVIRRVTTAGPTLP